MSYLSIDGEFNCKYPNWAVVLYNGEAIYEDKSPVTKFKKEANCSFELFKNVVLNSYYSEFLQIEIYKIDDKHCLLYSPKEIILEHYMKYYNEVLSPRHKISHIDQMGYVLDLENIKELPSNFYTRFKIKNFQKYSNKIVS